MITTPKTGVTLLTAGGIAAVLASTCCLGPLVLVLLGFSGAWIGNLTALERYRPWFLALAVLVLAFSAWSIFRPASACKTGTPCADPKFRRWQKLGFWVVCGLTVLALVFPYAAPLFY